MKVDKGLVASLAIGGTSGVVAVGLGYLTLTVLAFSVLWFNTAREIIKDNKIGEQL